MFRSVIVKLLGFTIAMFAGPIGVYFLTLHTLYHGEIQICRHTGPLLMPRSPGNSTWAGATAAFTANLVLIAYVYVAMMEDESEKVLAARKAKKGL